jgi:hypothetical protein
MSELELCIGLSVWGVVALLSVSIAMAREKRKRRSPP